VQPRILIVGMSHVEALRAAMTGAEAAISRIVNFSREPAPFGIQRMRERLIGRFRGGSPGPELMCLSIHGNYHNIIGLTNHPQRFVIGGADLPGQRVPEDMMLEHIRREHAPHLGLARKLAGRFRPRRLVILAPPPPIGDAEHITSQPGTFREMLANGVAPPETRVKLYDLQCRIHAEHAAALGAEFLPAPPEARKADGFLAPAYHGRDPTHGNAAYGRLVLDRLGLPVGVPA
jgi:hypothetical protein